MSTASHRFNNALRYRPGDDDAQTAFTPDYILAPVRRVLYGIGLDPCTTPDNPVHAARFYTPPTDGAVEPWDSDSIFVNPPYGKARERWVDRCIAAGADGRRVVLLMPAHSDTRAFQRAAAAADGVLFIKGRVKFGIPRANGRQVAASHPSALFGWNVNFSTCTHLGLLMVHRS